MERDLSSVQRGVFLRGDSHSISRAGKVRCKEVMKGENVFLERDRFLGNFCQEVN